MPPLPRRLPRTTPLLTCRPSHTIPRTLPFTRTYATDQPVTATNAAEHKGTDGGAEHGHGDHHESPYDPPGGWLWGVRPGEKYEKEGWENLFFYGFCGSIVVAGIVYSQKEDTSIQTWALEEARRRLEKEGFLEDPNSEGK